MKALIINGHIQWENISEGSLNHRIFEETMAFFNEKEIEIVTTTIDKGYQLDKEVEKWVEADYIVFHFPINWFSYPAKTKEYIDSVFMAGYDRLCNGDGRKTGADYGSGGLLSAKGMIVNTWNAPKDVFENNEKFFKGMSMEEVTMHFTANFEFVGISPLPTFAFYDVFSPTINYEGLFQKYKEHLETHMCHKNISSTK